MFDDTTRSDELEYDRLCRTIVGLRDEAIRARAESGIEQIWAEDREHYDGIDDANRSGKWVKPRDSSGRVTREPTRKKSTRSTVFLNITARYVNAAAAYVCDKLFRSDVANFGIKPTPKPDLIRQMDDQSPAVGADGMPIQMPVTDDQGNPQEVPHMVNGAPMMDQATGQPVMVPAMAPMTVADMAKQAMEQAKESAEKAKTQISDWLTECGINGQSRQVVLDAAMIGTGVLKGPFPEMQKSSAVITENGQVRMVIEEKLVPKSRRISAWNLYPDHSCGTDIQRGKYVFEVDDINARALGELKKDPSYLAKAIDEILEEGPTDPISKTHKRGREKTKSEKEVFQIWYYHGYLSADDLETAGYRFDDDEPEPEEEAGEVGLVGMEVAEEYGDAEEAASADDEIGGTEEEVECPCEPDRKAQYPVIVVMVNDRIIKATISPFDSGRFPYHVMRWQYRDDHWAGLGVSRQMRTSQEGVNAAVRLLHDNAGVSGAPILVVNRSLIEPADGNWSVGPHKVYYTTSEADLKNVRDAFTWIIAPSMQAEMMNIIQFWMRMAEEETGMPMLLQGQSGTIEHTYGEAQILNNNGSSMLRRVTNIYDDDVTKPHIGAYYEWLLIHGEDDSMKGDFQVEAMGSSVLIERDAHSQLLMQMLGLSGNPIYGADPELVFKEFLLSQRFDPEKLKLSEEKKAQAAQAMQNQGPPPQVAIAQMREQGATQRMQMELEAKAQSDQVEYAFRQWEANLQATLEAAQQDGDRAMNTDTIKANLAQNNAKLMTQVRLAMRPQGGPQVVRPATEPPQRAPNGQAFQQ